MSDIVSLLIQVLGSSYKKAKKGAELVFYCPFCHHAKHKLQCNPASQKWHCWVCGKKGRRFYTLFKLLRAPKEILDEVRGYKQTKEVYEDKEYLLQLPKEYTQITDESQSLFMKKALKYLSSRGFSNRDIIKYNLGICTSGPFEGRVIIPSYDDMGQLNFFTGRSFTGDSFKYKNPSHTKDVVGFEMFINYDEPLILCEGPLDAMTIKRNAIPLFGKTISKSLITKIIKKHVKKVYIVLDDDAIKDSIKMIERLLTYGIQTYFVKLKGKDPNEIGFNNIWNIIHETNPLNLKELVTLKLSQGRI